MTQIEPPRDESFIDPDLVGIDHALRAFTAQIELRDTFVADLDARIQTARRNTTVDSSTKLFSFRRMATPMLLQHVLPYPARRRALATYLVIIALCVPIVLGAVDAITRPQQVDASAIMERAEAIAANPTSVSSFHYRRESVAFIPVSFTTNASNTNTPSGETNVVKTTDEHWGVFPNRWRTDYHIQNSANVANSESVSGSVSDGKTEWSYDTIGKGIEVQIGALPSGSSVPFILPIQLPTDARPGQSVNDNMPNPCYRPKLVGEASVAGRSAYMIDLGPFLCPNSYFIHPDGTKVPGPITPTTEQGRHAIWVDKQTFFFLKYEGYNADGSLSAQSQVTEIQYNATIPPTVFTFAPPSGFPIVRTTDLRPRAYQLPDSITSQKIGAPPGLVDPSFRKK